MSTPADKSSSSQALAPWAIILAAGMGKRMGGGDLPKVLYPVAGEPMVRWVVRACREAGVETCVVVIGHKGEMVKQALAHEPGCVFVEQTQLLGTGHATRMAEPLFAGRPAREVFVLAGDGPLIRAQTLRTILDVHRSRRAAATLASSVIENPTGYGRVVRHADGGFKAIVEQKDATPQELAIREVYPSYACFESAALFESLAKVGNKNQSGEYYLTEVPAILCREGRRVEVIESVPAEDVLSINTPEQLAEVDAIFRKRRATSPGLAPGNPGSVSKRNEPLCQTKGAP
ncbi:MAG: NTP transferase domain-containing protein [Phycisphaeraceae bacterium]|nr:NTP transferase domain-containing protein [Phycisphaeraceae bacterium]